MSRTSLTAARTTLTAGRRTIARRRALLILVWRAGRWRAVVTGGLTVLLGVMPTAAVLATGMLLDALPEAVDQGLGSSAADRAVLALALVGGALVAGALLGGVVTYQVHLLDSAFGRTVHDSISRATLGTRGIAALEDPAVAGELASLEEFERADGFVTTVTALRAIVQGRTTGCASLVVLFAFAWWAPLVVLAGWRLFHAGVHRWIADGVELGGALGASAMRRPRYLRTLAVESPAAKEVRVFGLASWLVRSYSDTWLAAMRELWRGRRLGRRTTLLASGAVVAAHAVVIGAIGWQALHGAVAVGQLVVFVQATLATAELGWVGDPEEDVARARQVALQVLHLEERLGALGGDRSADPRVVRPALTIGRRGGPIGVRLEGVRFTYRGRSEPTLHELDLTIPPGQSLAVVGENGAGKTTLIKLLCGLYAPDEGRIVLDGGAAIGVIFQDFVRYELSLRENIGFGHLASATDVATLERPLADAGAADLLEKLPHGWDTVLSAAYDGGQDLSGGQWQKVALARALTAIRGGAGLLILDEPTAALDVRAETELFDRFLDLTTGVTTILVSHRLASVRHADRIVVIGDGRVVEDGTHDELLADGGRYARMFRLQADRFAAAGRD
ncbi:MAG TPA: ABC transporter ATP-binding protein [Actinopolymorphaceae bacterium]